MFFKGQELLIFETTTTVRHIRSPFKNLKNAFKQDVLAHQRAVHHTMEIEFQMRHVFGAYASCFIGHFSKGLQDGHIVCSTGLWQGCRQTKKEQNLVIAGSYQKNPPLCFGSLG